MPTSALRDAALTVVGGRAARPALRYQLFRGEQAAFHNRDQGHGEHHLCGAFRALVPRSALRHPQQHLRMARRVQRAPAGQVLAHQFRQSSSNERCPRKLLRSELVLMPALQQACEAGDALSGRGTSDVMRKGLPQMVLRSTFTAWSGRRQPFVRRSWMRVGGKEG